jgi:tape measure domain-containing protein
MSIAELVVMMKLNAEQLKSGLQTIKSKFSGLDDSIRKAVPGSQLLAKGILAITAAAAGLVIKSISLAAELEQTEVAFTTLLGSGEAASQMMKDLQSFAASTPFQFTELADGAKKLAAFGVETEDIIESMRMLGDVSAGIGAPIGEIAEIYGKAKVQGRLFMEDINQLTGRGIPIIQELAAQFGVTESEVRDLVSSGQVNFGHLEQAFVRLTSEGGKFSGMMEAQSQTIGGLWSTLKDNVTISLATIGTTIIDAFDLKDKMTGFIEGLENLTTNIQTFADMVSEVGLKEALETIFSEETQFKIALIAGAILGALVPAAYAAATAFFAMMIPLIPFILIGAALAALAYLIYANWDKLKAFFVSFWDSIKGAWEAAKAWFSGLVETIKSYFINKWNETKTQTLAIWTAIVTGVKDKATAIKEGIVNAVQIAIDWIKGLPGQAISWGRDLINGFIDGVKRAASGLIDAVKGAISDAIAAAKKLLGISSPSKVFEGFGLNVGAGFIEGIDSMKTMVAQSMQGMVTPPVGQAFGTGGGNQSKQSSQQPTNHSVTLGMNGLFAGAHITIGSERDAKSMAREIFRLADARARSEGVMI